MDKWDIPADAELPDSLVQEIRRIYREVKIEDDAFWESCGLEHRASDNSLSLSVWIRLSPIQRHIIMEQVGHDRNLSRWQKYMPAIDAQIHTCEVKNNEYYIC